ncbi:MAG: hypothetical protein DRN71_05535 [Candidatus Nanohalarchaeota archaeon]|nr:MAG: hypothetical protein DRN71_05535 [Candidatus Nanohaloarchaeota archaeon]
MVGLEIELHIIDEKGKLSYKGLDLINKIKTKYPEINVVKECGLNMVETGCYPHMNAYNPAVEMIGTIETIIRVAKENKLRVYPFGTYPGKTESRFTPDINGNYKIKEKIFGVENFSLATKAVGFHHYYALPKGVFDYEKKNLRLLIDSKLKRSLLNTYNFEIAIDPILTLLTQSSPFFEGKLLAKDSRMLIYRGGKKLGYPGLYSNFQQVGALPPYKQTETDLIRSIKRRQQRWKRAAKKADKNVNFGRMYATELDISWNPIKINKHGTLEQRGMDMNYMSIVLGVSVLLKSCLKKIQREFIEVIPSDIGIKDSFKLHNGIMYIPPHIFVREKLQKSSAYKGFDDDALYGYTKRFYMFAKSVTPEIYNPLLKNIENMIRKKSSVSDKIVGFAKRKKMIDSSGEISQKDAQVIALHFSKKFENDLKKTREIVEKIRIEHVGL